VSSHLLVVDDDPATRLALSEALRLHFSHATIDTASTAERALILMATSDFEVIISDVRMPGMSGLDFLKELKGLRPETIVILVTGCEASLSVEALRAGAYAFLEKPLRMETFIPLVRTALEHAQCLRQIPVQGLEPSAAVLPHETL
jgi:DNA-binding NtrC family response regulator